MSNPSRRESMRRLSGRYPLGMGVLAGAVWTFVFWLFLDPPGTGLLITFTAFTALFTLTAWNERRRRKRMNLPR